MGPFGSICYWLTQAVMLLSGQLDSAGGALFARGAFNLVDLSPGKADPDSCPRTLARGLAPVAGGFPVAALAEEITLDDPGRIRALFVSGGNPAHSVPGSDLGSALDELELLVCIDLYRSETAQRADYILPATDSLEHSDFPLAWMLLQETPYAQYTPAVVPPAHGRVEEWRIFSDLAVACGASAWGSTLCNLPPRINAALRRLPGRPELTPDVLIGALLRSGRQVRLGDLKRNPGGVLLKPHEPGSFLNHRVKTDSGRVQLAPPALLGDLDRLERDADRRASSTGGDESAIDALDMTLIGKRERRTHNSWIHNVARIAQPTGQRALMHPDDASRLGVSDGAEVCITGAATTAQMPVQVSDEILPGVIAVPHGWGHGASGVPTAQRLAGSNYNDLVPAGVVEQVSGQAIMVGHRVRVMRSAD